MHGSHTLRPLPTPPMDLSALNSLLRGEISAAESYDLAMPKFAEEPVLECLQHIRTDHLSAVFRLRERILQAGGDPVESSGAWGTFAAAVTGTALMLGTQSILSALRQGEEHGVGEYEKAIESAAMPEECRRLIEHELLPLCRQHVETLRQVSESAA